MAHWRTCRGYRHKGKHSASLRAQRLLSPSKRSDGRHWVYDRQNVRRVYQIPTPHELGFSVHENRAKRCGDTVVSTIRTCRSCERFQIMRSRRDRHLCELVRNRTAMAKLVLSRATASEAEVASLMNLMDTILSPLE